MPEDGQEDAPEEVRAGQAGEPGKAQAQKDKAASESYEERQMLWKGMAGRSWTELVQQWGVPQVEALQLQKSIASLMMERQQHYLKIQICLVLHSLQEH